jgi:hypothetical protein
VADLQSRGTFDSTSYDLQTTGTIMPLIMTCWSSFPDSAQAAQALVPLAALAVSLARGPA